MQPCDNVFYDKDPDAPPWAPPTRRECGRPAGFVITLHRGKHRDIKRDGPVTKYRCRYCVRWHRTHPWAQTSIRRIEDTDC